MLSEAAHFLNLSHCLPPNVVLASTSFAIVLALIPEGSMWFLLVLV
jgi:hypothetical protein